jgi:hypothetical protein
VRQEVVCKKRRPDDTWISTTGRIERRGKIQIESQTDNLAHYQNGWAVRSERILGAQGQSHGSSARWPDQPGR